MEMSLRQLQIGERQVLVASGDVDLVSLPRFNDALARLVSGSTGRIVVVDIDGTGLFEDAALGLLIGAAGRARTQSGDLVVVCTEPRLRERLAQNGFDRAVSVADSISNA